MHHKDLIKTPSLKHTINDKNQIEEGRVEKYLIFFHSFSLLNNNQTRANNPFNNFLVLKK